MILKPLLLLSTWMKLDPRLPPSVGRTSSMQMVAIDGATKQHNSPFVTTESPPPSASTLCLTDIHSYAYMISFVTLF